MPVWLAVIGNILLFFLLYYLLRLISNIRSLTARLRAWNRERRVRRAWQRTHRGFIALAAGEWTLAEKDLIRAAKYTNTPILNYLAAARSAQAQHNIAKRDEYLSKITVTGKLPTLALGLTQTRLQLREHQYEQALATLQQLQHIAPHHKLVLLLLKKTYLHLKDWGSLEILFAQLEKHAILKPDNLKKLQVTLYQGLLQSATKQKDNAIDLVWQRIPKSLKLLPELLLLYLPYASKNNVNTEKLLHSALSHAESLLPAHPQDATLFYNTGLLCLSLELWGKARHYFETSLDISPRHYPASIKLANLLEKLNEPTKALELYRSL